MTIKKKPSLKEKQLVSVIDKQDQLVSVAVHEMDTLMQEVKSLKAQNNHLLSLVNILIRH